MSYGTIKVDTITFTDDGSDVSVSVSGLAKNPTISGDLTVTGTISGTVIQGGTTVSGATVTGTTANFVSGVYTTQISGATITGDAGQFTTLTGGTAGFTTVTGTTVTGTTANFVSGVFTTQISGATITGDAGEFTTLTGGTADFTTVTGTTAGFTTVTGTTVTGTTANFVTVSGTTVTGDTGNFTTATVTSGVFASGTAAAPSVSVGATDNGLYSPGADEVAISTNGTGQLFVDASGNVGVNVSAGAASSNELLLVGDKAIRWQHTTDGTEYGDIYVDTSSNIIFRVDTSLSEKLRIASDGKVGVGTSSPAELLHLSAGTGTNTDINSVNNLIEISDLNSRYNGTSTAAGNFTSGLIFDAYQANGNRRSGSFIYQVVSSNNFAGAGVGMRTSLVFGTRGDDVSPTGSPLERLRIDYQGNVGIGVTNPSSLLHLAEAGNITVGTTTGTKIGTSTSQKIGFYDKTPVVQPTTGIAEAAFVENSGGTAVNVDSTFGGYTIQQVVEALQTLGLLA